MTSSNTVFTVFAGIGLVLSLIPLVWHRNVATCAYMIWTALACLAHFVDSIVWSGNTVNRAPVWCDISIRIKIGVSVAWPACILCIIRRLYNITATTTASISKAEKRRGIITDLLIAVGIPILEMGLEYVVATHRFDILEDYGCATTTLNTPPAFALVYTWPLIIAVISAFYGALTIHAFRKRRKEFRAHIAATSNLSYDFYWRLVALSSVDFTFTIPLATYGVVANILSGVEPWTSWADIHKDFPRVYQIPRTALETNPGIIYAHEVLRWVAVLAAFLFFGFFGFAEEARRNYRLIASPIAKKLGYSNSTRSAATSEIHTVDISLHFASPVSTVQQPESKRDSAPLLDTLLTSTDEYDLEAQPGPSAEQRTSTGSPGVATPINDIPHIVEAIFDSERTSRLPVAQYEHS